ncbi:MAG: ATP-binding protein [Desulfosalsimonadaceae bacterium]
MIDEMNPSDHDNNQKLLLNLAIVGGGRACKFFLNLFAQEPLPHLDIRLVGVCDINPKAEGLVLAKKMGIYTTDDFRELFALKGLDAVIELTNNKDTLISLIHEKPKGVGILEHNMGRFIRTLFDIDQQLKYARHEAEMEKMLSDFLIRQTNQQILILNPDFTVADINEACLSAIGKSRSEIVGSPCYSTVYGYNAPCPTAVPGFECPMLQTLKTGESAHVIQENPFSQEQATYFDIITYPVKNSYGEIIRVIEIWRDITRQLSSRMEKRVRELKSDLNKLVQEDRMISLGKLSASCVHEINNPIQGLLTFSQFIHDSLETGIPGDAEREHLKEISALMTRELERCGEIISGLLSFSRETPMHYTTTNLNEVLEAVIRLTHHKMELQNISLKSDLTEKLLVINGDPNRLQQCFLNLVFNSIEALTEGGYISIASWLNQQDQTAVVEIRDNGGGIPKENLEHIFDPFFTTKQHGEGTGLGLSIVYGIVKNHGGEIEVKSNSGQETAFILSFPLVNGDA